MQTELDLPLDNARHEAFAQARAAGRTTHEAARLAGYARPPQKAAEVWRRADVVARTRTILERRRAGGSRDLGGLIDRLIALADKAAGPGDARGSTSPARAWPRPAGSSNCCRPSRRRAARRARRR